MPGQRRKPDDNGSSRVKNAVMLGVLLIWMGYLAATVFRGGNPEAWTWGIPSGVYVALYQPWGARSGSLGRGQNQEVPSTPNEETP